MVGNDQKTRRKVLEKIGAGAFGAAGLIGTIPSVRASGPSTDDNTCGGCGGNRGDHKWESKKEDEHHSVGSAYEWYRDSVFSLRYHGAKWDSDSISGDHWRHEFSIVSEGHAVKYDDDAISQSDIPNVIHEHFHGEANDDSNYPRDKVKNNVWDLEANAFEYTFKAEASNVYTIDDDKSLNYQRFYSKENSSPQSNDTLVDGAQDALIAAIGLRNPVMGASLAATSILLHAGNEYDENLNGNGVIGQRYNFEGSGIQGTPAHEHSQWFYVKSKPNTSGSITINSHFDEDATRGIDYLHGVTWEIGLDAEPEPYDKDSWHNNAGVIGLSTETQTY